MRKRAVNLEGVVDRLRLRFAALELGGLPVFLQPAGRPGRAARRRRRAGWPSQPAGGAGTQTDCGAAELRGRRADRGDGGADRAVMHGPSGG